MAISPQQLTIYLYSAHRAVIFAIAQLSCLSLSQNISKTYQVRLKLKLLTNRKSHMGFPLTPRSMTLDDLEPL